MCGIAGFVDLEGGRGLDAARLDRMVDALTLRGPDDRGTALNAPVALGMRRLSIIDLEGGHQPIENEDGTTRVVMNGELYSYPELRDELIARGHTFRTHSDTEVLVHGYEEWGIDGVLSRLNGMFAFALHDARRECVYLCRDRLGIKPLLYAERDGWLLFGSAMSAVLASGLVPAEPDPVGLRLYLHNQFIPGSRSAIEGVRKLPPASYVVVKGGEVSAPRRWWHFPETTTEDRPYEEWVEELRTLLDDAVRVHMISDVEVGVFLSGGLDSTTALALMTRHASHPVKAYSIGFEDKKIFDELPQAEAAAKRFGADFHATVFTPRHVLELATRLIENIEEPIGDAACIPTLLLAETARRDVKVVLSGEGADEMFAGYDYYKSLPPRRPESRVNFDRGDQPSLLRRLLGRDTRALRVTSGFNGASPLSGFPYAMSPDFVELLLADLAPPEDFAGTGAANAALEESWIARQPGADTLHRALLVDSQGWLPEDLLMKVDRTTMAHSLEARVPFLDYRVAELASRMPSSVKLRGGSGKSVLRDAFERDLGHELTHRKKHGFNLPMFEWVRGDLRPLIEDTLSGSALDDLPWLAQEPVQALLDAHMQGCGNLERPIWSLYVLAAWFRHAR